jgi:hypothetical protein
MRYDYQCEATGQVVEVEHKLSETISTWGELCERAGISPGDTPGDSPVRRLITGGTYLASSSSGPCSGPSCVQHVHSGGCCGGGGCGWEG